MSSLLPGTEPPPDLPERPDGAPPAERSGADRWPPWSAGVVLVAALVASFIGQLVVFIIGVAAGADIDADEIPPGVAVGSVAVQDIMFVAVPVLFAASMAGRPWAGDFGLRGTRALPAIGWSILALVAYAVFVQGYSVLVDLEEQDVLDILGVEESTLLLVLGAIVVCVGAPLAEEFLFRGYMYRALRNWRGVLPAAALTGVAFGAIHILGSPVEALVPLAVLGFFFCLLYERTGSLLPCIGLHAVNNAIAFSYMIGWDWQALPLAAGALLACGAVALPVARRWRPAPSG